MTATDTPRMINAWENTHSKLPQNHYVIAKDIFDCGCKLERELSSAQEQLAAANNSYNFSSQCHAQEIADLTAQLAAARVALEKYGFHLKECICYSINFKKECSCGLKEALAGGGQ